MTTIETGCTSHGPVRTLIRRTAGIVARGGASVALGGALLVALVASPASAATSPPQVVAGTANLVGVDCPTATQCSTVGINAGFDQGVAVPVSSGVAGMILGVQGTTSLSDIPCPTTTTCVAVGAVGPFLNQRASC